MQVDTSSWREFRVGDLFELERCKCSNATMLGDGDIPYVGATVNNNGIIKYVSDITDGTWVSEGNCIVFICDGQGSNGYQVYIAPDFIGSTTCKIGRIDGLNELRALFLISVLNLNRSRYSYGYMEKRNMTALSNEVIKLPVALDGEPDWDYMEQYMKAVMDRQAHVIDSLTRISKEKHPVDVGAWGEFRVGDLFDVQRGQRHVVHNHEPGDIPYYSASLVNNGVTDLIGNPLFVANDAIVVTTFGDAFWADGNFTASDECSILTHSNMNELSGLFVATVYMAHNKRKYSFKLKAFSGRVADDVVFLPVTPGGEPDWSYMEQYMRTVMDRQEHVVRCLARLRE